MSTQLNFRSLPALLAVLVALVVSGAMVFVGGSSRAPNTWHAPDGMVYVAGGTYMPLYTSATDTAAIEVAPFYLDRYPVTNAEYLAFVQANPEWQRSAVSQLFADEGYLQHWAGDLDYGPDSLARRPVVNVSWFAAAAYADWQGKRLPSTAEWERAAAASATQPDGQNDPVHRQMILDWYSRKTGRVSPAVGSSPENYWGAYDLHGVVWEWVLDFNTAMVTGDARNNADFDLKLFCGSGTVGASNFRDYAAFVRFAYRSGLEASYTVPNLGFRCARSI